MDYKHVAHETLYSGTLFRSRLEARWAAFFDLAGWKWRYEPVDLAGWTPDFWVHFSCGHSEDPAGHELYVEVKPFDHVQRFWDERHAATKVDPWASPSPAVFGLDPEATYWVMVHGHGGGEEFVPDWVFNWRELWAEAGNVVRYRPGKAAS